MSKYDAAGVFGEVLEMLRSAKGATSNEMKAKMKRRWGPTKYQLLPVAEKLDLILHMEKKEGESETRYRFLTPAQAQKMGVEQPAFAVSQLDKVGRMTAEPVEKAVAAKTPEPKRKTAAPPANDDATTETETKAKTAARAPAKAKAKAKAAAKRKATARKKAA